MWLFWDNGKKRETTRMRYIGIMGFVIPAADIPGLLLDPERLRGPNLFSNLLAAFWAEGHNTAEGMDPHSSPHTTHYGSFHVLFYHPYITLYNPITHPIIPI